MSEGIVTKDVFLHSIEMYFSFLKQFEFLFTGCIKK